MLKETMSSGHGVAKPKPYYVFLHITTNIDPKISFIQIGSYIHDDSQIFFTGNYGHDLSNQRAQQYELFAKKLHPNDTYLFYANRCK